MGLLKQLTKTVLETALGKDDRSPGPRQTGLGRRRHGQYPQQQAAEDGVDRAQRRGADRRAAGSGGDVRTAVVRSTKPIARFKGGKPKPPRQVPR
jgi:hypothetical protein